MANLSFDDRDGLIWMDGQMVPWRDSNVHVLTHGLHYASSVFEGERVYNKRVFKLREHSQRLIDSARLLGFELPLSVEELDQATEKVVAANNIVDGYVRPVAWRGSEMMGVSAQKNTIHVAIATWEWPSYFSPEARMKGIRMKMSPWRRPDPQTAPTKSKAAGLYMICTMAKHEAEAEGCDDALMLDYRGYLAESTGANLFLVIDGKIHTPTPDCFLNGITRQTVIELARARGIEVIERHMDPSELGNAQEVFLTGTAAEVTPVGQIGEYHYTPGHVCEVLINDFNSLVRVDPNDIAITVAAE